MREGSPDSGPPPHRTDPVIFSFNPTICATCGGRCEKACRRGRLDTPLRIRDLLRRAATPTSAAGDPGRKSRFYQHHLGHVPPTGIHRLFRILEAGNDRPVEEARRCLQCGCVAAADCLLRSIATQAGARQHRFRGEPIDLSGPIRSPQITYDPGKCVRCHRCIELGKRLKPECGPIMAGRGRHSFVEAPFQQEFGSAFAGFEPQFVAECPTGALAIPFPPPPSP
jgi:ferredoxin